MLINSNNILNAYNYQLLSDVSFNYLEDFNYNKTIKSGSIIFCKTDFLGKLFNIIHNDGSYILITHHSDYSITEELFNSKPESIKKWFCINPQIFNDSIIPIPLGIKTHKGSYLEPQYMSQWFSENVNSLRLNEKEEVIYVNFNLTNSSRKNLVDSLSHLNLKITNNLPFNKYIEDMSRCRFVLSPPGNGVDCHRTWEALYVGCVPIVIKNKLYNFFNDLPILQVDNFKDINNDMLINFKNKTFNYEKLSIYYWKHLLLKKKNEINTSR